MGSGLDLGDLEGPVVVPHDLHDVAFLRLHGRYGPTEGDPAVPGDLGHLELDGHLEHLIMLS